MLIERAIIQYIQSELIKEHSKILVIYGARRVGETTLVETIV